jgi:DNA-binding NarL/FixJ family response regulator
LVAAEVHNRVLVVDDSAVVREIIGSFLTDAGFVVCGEAADGLAAIEKAKELKPDLVLLDLSMPHMNGAEAASVLRSALPDVRLILFTMHSEAIGNSLGSAVGVDLVLSKPNGMRQLIGHARALLAGKESNSSES